MEQNRERAVITVVGKDQYGIIAEVTATLRDYRVNVEDISQTIMQDIFDMMMLVNLENMDGTFKQLKDRLEELGRRMNLQITIQHTAIFDSMHRI